MEQFTASVGFDRRLYQEDIAGSIAHARMLEKISVLSKEECSSIVNGLNDILAEITSGKFDWRVELEDVHMNIEHQLIERIGDTGKKLHTGRSRNDQIATDIRLYLRKAIDQLTTEGRSSWAAWRLWRWNTVRHLCQGLLICKQPSRSLLGITSWRGTLCSNAILNVWRIVANEPIDCRWVLRPGLNAVPT